MVGIESSWGRLEGMTIDVLSRFALDSRVYPVAAAAYVMAFAREARSNRESNLSNGFTLVVKIFKSNDDI